MRSLFLRFFSTITGQFTAIAFLASGLLVANVLYTGNRTLDAALLENIKLSVGQTSQLLNLTVSTYASNNDLQTVQTFLDEILDKEAKNGLTYVLVANSQDKPLISTLALNAATPAPDIASNYEKAARSGIIHVRNRLLLPGNEIGFLQYGLSTKNIIAATTNERMNSLMRTLVVVLLTFFAIVFLGRQITKSLQQMNLASREIVAGNFHMRIAVSGNNELDLMSAHFNRMVDAVQAKINEITELNQSLESRVQSRTLELENSKQQLENNLMQLKEAQRQLISKEKLASLGSLVAGIAHELNTPIGNAYTVSTTVSEKVEEFEHAHNDASIKKSTLNRFAADMAEAADLLSKNLKRASELINSFKTVAVDQASENRRRFNLLKTMEELAITLQPQLKKTKISYRIDIPSEIVMDSYPGPLIQVISNLFNNAVLHGFEGRDGGELTLTAKLDEHDSRFVQMQFGDNGVGIQTHNLDRIFDPFFTTKFGQGGSGLGLNICYNIVSGLLRGQISVQSDIEVGTRFTLLLPLLAED
ncbi:sensor histidine kinase [Undibacterium flavidum]|uniref:histidine kinase n=1 Tax=Undibacterium flavidum TaxID=2762297 RepID=A0ABR6Y936_9BURK|nr:HAMP domain-containing sensor histidine kinase [Undibacterium flavidum]MBC3872737.1 HAMP domain-containing histidine kinase [Undibacterium flavidum]